MFWPSLAILSSSLLFNVFVWCCLFVVFLCALFFFVNTHSELELPYRFLWIWTIIEHFNAEFFISYHKMYLIDEPAKLHRPHTRPSHVKHLFSFFITYWRSIEYEYICVWKVLYNSSLKAWLNSYMCNLYVPPASWHLSSLVSWSWTESFSRWLLCWTWL